MDTYHYTDSGLDNVWLHSGFKVHNTDYGEGVSVRNIDELHKVIGMSIAESLHSIKPKELRFLRVEMELSQKRLAEFLRVDSQTVARWEKGETEIPGPAELIIRHLYIEHAGGDQAIRWLCENLAELDELENAGRRDYEATDDHWRMVS